MRNRFEMENLQKFDQLLEENERTLTRFSDRGADLRAEKEFEFTVSLNSKSDCELFRDAYRKNHKLPEGGFFILVNDPKDYRLLLCVKMKPVADKITEIEAQLLSVSGNFEGAEVSWEFEE